MRHKRLAPPEMRRKRITSTSLSQHAILAALNSTGEKPVHVGWFIPNSTALIQTLRNVARRGKKIGTRVEANGVINFFAQDPGGPSVDPEGQNTPASIRGAP